MTDVAAVRAISAVLNARIPGRSGPQDLCIDADGRWASISDSRRPLDVSSGDGATSADVLDADGALLLPGFVDPHVHLDKAYLLDDFEREGLDASSLDLAIAATRELRVRQGDLRTSRVVASAERALSAMVRHGTVAARVHVEVDPDLGFEMVEAQLDLARRWADVITIQTVAFPQQGLDSTAARTAVEKALELGCEVIGSCPYVDEDPADHLRYVTALAADTGRQLDVHLDFSDDPTEIWIDVLLDCVERRGLDGKVAVGHLTSLAVAPAIDLASRIERLAATGTGVISLPFTDLYLNGRGHPPARGVTPLRHLYDAGVAVALGSNNHQNPFTPVGTGNLLQVAMVAALVGNFATTADHERLLASVSTSAATMIGVGSHRVEAGDLASFVLVDVPSAATAVREAPAIVTSAHRGIIRRADALAMIA